MDHDKYTTITPYTPLRLIPTHTSAGCIYFIETCLTKGVYYIYLRFPPDFNCISLKPSHHKLIFVHSMGLHKMPNE